MEASDSSPGRLLVVFAAFVVAAAGLKMASSIVNPLLLSAFISILCAPCVSWLVVKRVPIGLAILLVMIGIVTIGILLGAFLGQSLNDFSGQIPLYEERLKLQIRPLVQFMSGFGWAWDISTLTDQFDPGVAMRLASNLLSGVGAVLGNMFLILLTVMFLLAEAHSFPIKLRQVLKDPERSLSHFAAFLVSVKSYLLIKSLVSVATGVLVTLLLMLMKIDYPLLWGLFAFMLNYVPNIGSIIAAVPAVLLALIQHGLWEAVVVGAGYMVVNVVMGNLVEPRFLGKGLGLSTLVVFLSLIFWGWILGPVGMLLSIPLTMIVKIALESNEATRWVGVILGAPVSTKEG